MAGARGIRYVRIRPRTNHTSFSSRPSSSSHVQSRLSSTPRNLKDVRLGRGAMCERPSTPRRHPTRAGLAVVTNFVFLALILNACAPKKERTHSWSTRIPASESATMAVSSA